VADFVAKSALKRHSDHPYGSITLSACKSLVALHVEDLWQLRWHRSLTGCVTHSYIPFVGSNITFPRLRCSAISYTRLLLGDTTLNVHMERMGLAESRNCQCGMGIDDEHHFFFECPYYHEFRQQLVQSVQDILLTGRITVASNLSVSLVLGFQAFSFLCTFVPGSEKTIERTFAPVELSFHGTFAFRSSGVKVPRTFVPWNIRSRGTFVPQERTFQELPFL